MGGSRIALVTFAALAVHGVVIAEPTRASARVRAPVAAFHRAFDAGGDLKPSPGTGKPPQTRSNLVRSTSKPRST